MYDVLDICRYIVNYCNQQGYRITNLKLQKLLYFIQAVFLTDTDAGNPCFNATIEAWDFGPVVPEAYHAFKQYGSSNIPRITEHLIFDDDNLWGAHVEKYDDNCIEENDKQVIRDVVDDLSGYSASQLVDMTHQQEPWINAYRKGRNREITINAIRDYFNE